MTDSASFSRLSPGQENCITQIRTILLDGAVDAAMDLSGVTLAGDYLVLGADQGHQLQVLQREPGVDRYRLQQKLALAKQDQEVDIKAISYAEGHLYVAGSHSRRRRRFKPELSVRKNHERLLAVEEQGARNRLYRVSFDSASGQLGSPERIDLSKRLRKDPLLRPFCKLPSKENGVEIQGVAVCGARLHLGFRGPVLRDNYVPVMSLFFDRPKDYMLNFVCLEGQGIRDLVALGGGFLILSGPINDTPGPFCLWFWDGVDQVPGKDRQVVPTRLLGEVSSPGGAKAEGLALLSTEPDSAEVLIVYDINNTGQAVRMRVNLAQ